MAAQSFTSIAREQILRLPLGRPCCMAYELGALYKTAGVFSFGSGAFYCAYRVHDAALARRLIRLLKSRLRIEPELSVISHPRFGGKKAYTLSMSQEDSHILLSAIKMLQTRDDGALMPNRAMPRRVMSRGCCRAAFLRGAFLGGGSVTDPDKSYHLEIVTRDEAFGGFLIKIAAQFGIAAKMVDRKSAAVVYIKQSQAIIDFLTLIGAHDAVMRMTETLVIKSVRNSANRHVNCDSMNADRQLSAAEKQVSSISALERAGGLDGLDGKLKEMAFLRLREPDASLRQLGEMLTPPLGKSGVNHRLDKIIKHCDKVTHELKKQKEGAICDTRTAAHSG
ncbi:MAG: DNA-binding protein WhiA [Clostridia bacterium]|nr:DNA-binding protein WhiA [Clostridia bacterium]